MIPTRSTLGQHQVIPAIVPIEIRAFGEDASLLQNFVLRADELLRFWIVLLNDYAREAMTAFAEIPFHVHEPFAPIVVVKQRRIKTNRV